MDRDHKPTSSSADTEASTIYRSTKPGAASSAGDWAEGGGLAGGSAVDAALATTGQGESHASGATIHKDATAHDAAAELGAAAFTAGSDIFFGAGHYSPGTEQGDALLRHELAHVEQTRGLAAPTPGNYKVSQPGDAAEVAATAAESGGAAHGDASAEAGTIHTKKETTAAAAADATDKLQEFFDALAAHNVADAKTKWDGLKAADKARMRKAKVKNYPAGLKADPIESIIEIMGKEGLPIMKETKAAFDKKDYSDAILDDATHDAAYWMPALKGAGVFDAWLAKLPKHAALGEKRLAKLDPWMTQASAVGDTKKIWDHAFPKLRDKTYNAGFLKATAWGKDDVKRLWKALSGKLPLAHMQTISGGFNLGTHEKLDGKTWNALGFGWHHPGPNVIVMPNSSSDASGGGTGHDMTGGGSSGVKVAGTAADPKLTHWDGTALHEIGHGVGEATDGNDFAKKHGEWDGSQGWDAWSKHLFNDATAKSGLPTPAPKPLLAPTDARHFLSAEIAGQKFVPPKWKRTDVVDFINTHYSDQKLVKYWDSVKTGTPSYHVDTNNHAGSKTYVWLERGGLGYTSYKKSISDNKVSWYSLSSTVEWFAEQYANYYRTGKAGTGADAATKKKLDTIDGMEATKKGGLKKASPGAGGEGGGGEAGEGADAAPIHGSADDRKGGGPQSGDTSTESLASQIHRINF